MTQARATVYENSKPEDTSTHVIHFKDPQMKYTSYFITKTNGKIHLI